MGYLSLEVDEDYGGMDLDFLYSTIICGEMGKLGSLVINIVVGVHVYLAMNYLIHAGSSYIEENHLAPRVAGQLIGSLSMTEPFTDSDVRSIRTTATIDGDHYIVNGSKILISNGYLGDYTVAAVKTESGISIMVIELDADGVSRTKLDKVGIRCSDTAELAFDNAYVPKENLLGQ